MLDERRKSILSIIDEYGEISLTELSSLFPDVSSMTIRRDLSELESRGCIIRTKGRALSVRKINPSLSPKSEENEYSLRARENILQKKAIAKKALSFVQKGRSIYFDAGSTIMALAELVPNDNMTIITNGINVAQALVSNSNINKAELKRKVISRAKKTIMLLDQSKIGKDLLFTLADISEIHVLITDGPLSADLQRFADQNGVTVIS